MHAPVRRLAGRFFFAGHISAPRPRARQSPQAAPHLSLHESGILVHRPRHDQTLLVNGMGVSNEGRLVLLCRLVLLGRRTTEAVEEARSAVGGTRSAARAAAAGAASALPFTESVPLTADTSVIFDSSTAAA
eukprot:4675134-Prymnesium_polylepis.1